jgi:DNA polymerase
LKPNLVTCDLETFYSQTYSLTKVTTEEYIRSPQYETIGISLKLNDDPTVWVPQPKVDKVLRQNKWSDKMVICQNTAFDGAILNWHYDVNPMLWIDIMGMSRALFPHEKSHSLNTQAARMGVGVKGNEVLNAIGKRYKDFTPDELSRYGEYCCNDTDLTKLLFNKYMAMGFPKIELRLLDLTLRMFIDPVLMLDEPKLRVHLTEVQDRKQALMESVRDTMLAEADPDYVHAIFSEGMDGIKKLLMSNDKFAKLLQSFGVEPPTKVSPTTGKLSYAFAKTDEAFKELGEHDDERVQILVAARLGNKSTLEETRTQRFIEMSHRGVFPVPLRYYGAHSGRWSGQDSVNLQNLTSNPRNPNAGKIKKTIMAPPGYVVIDCDSSQIEARTLAWLAGQQDLLDAFEAKQDVYKIMASRIYNKPVEEIIGIERQVGKVVILGAGYGVGHAKLKVFLKTIAGVDVTEAEAKRIIDAYRAAYPRIPELWRKADDSLRALAMGNGLQVDAVGVVHAVPDKGLSLPNGLHIQYPELRQQHTPAGGKEWVYYSKGMSVKVYGGKVVENFCQAIARCVIAEQMLRIGKRYKVVLTVHDAIAIVARVEEAEEAREYVEECMRWRPTWAQGLPLACESGMGASYGDC